MIIGYDGKRAFQNTTGLGNYSRSLLGILANNYPENNYLLFAPKQTNLFDLAAHENIDLILPKGILNTTFKGLWRRRSVLSDIKKTGAAIFHGLSNELPAGIKKSGTKSVVTVHDLIFERHPETYNFDERYTHRWKIKQACEEADAIIAISDQTKQDLINFYRVEEQKIYTIYQSCNPIFEQEVSAENKNLTREKYHLPSAYFLFVSSITARKNLIAICHAMILLKKKLDIPLVIIGDGKKEKEAVKKLADENGIADQMIFLNELSVSKEETFISAADFPAIYQQAIALIYPSIFEGFGLPVLEALWSRTPVICSNTSSMPEVGADAALYFAPDNYEVLANNMLQVATNKTLAEELSNKGYQQAKNFTRSVYAENVMNVYKKLL